MHICHYYHDDDFLPPEIRAALEDTLYAGFVGQPATPEADAPAESSPPDSSGAPSAVRATLERLVATVGFTKFTRRNERLSERIAHEAVHWVSERWGAMEEDDPYADEARAISEMEGQEDVDTVAEMAVSHRPELTPVTSLATRKRHEGPNESHAGIRAEIDRDARRGIVIGQWRARMERDREHHRARLLGRALGGLVRELEALVPRLAEEQRLVRDALGNEDALWDLGRHEWEELPLGGIAEAAAMLSAHPEIGRLAEILGRSRAVTERRTRITTERTVRLRPVGIGKSEVTGVRAGDDLTSLMTSELALLSQPETEELFYAKLAHRELLVLDYNRMRVVEDVRLRPISISEDAPVERGPAIICVDTSGSMLGLPEQVAKATVLALARRLAIDRRRVEVLAFSSDVRSFTMDHDSNRLPELARFLAGSFHGGTDLGKALATAIERLAENAYRYADVLVVSDFRVPKIADRFLAEINRHHHRGTLFHSLTISRAPVIDPLHIFDSSWLFSTESGRIAPESLRAIH